MKKMIVCGLVSTLLLFTSCMEFKVSRGMKPSETIAEKMLMMSAFDRVVDF